MRFRADWLLLFGLVALFAPTSAVAEFGLPGQESGLYYSYAIVAGEEVKIRARTQVTGNVHSNGQLDVKRQANVGGNVSAVGAIRLRGSVAGTVVEGAEGLALPRLYSRAEALAVADRVFRERTVFVDEVIDDIVFVDGDVAVRGSLSGTGTLISSGEIRISSPVDAFSDLEDRRSAVGERARTRTWKAASPPPPEMRLALISEGNITVMRGRSLRAVLRAGGDILAGRDSWVEGVFLADGGVGVSRDSVVRFLNLDEVPPEVTFTQPAEGSFVVDPQQQVTATLSDNFSGVVAESIQLLLDGVDRSAEVAISGSVVTYRPSEPLSDGPHIVELTLEDNSGNRASSTVNFTTDTIHPLITIENLEEGQFLNAEAVTVTGSAADASPIVAVTVNGEPATLSPGAFSVPVTLSPGFNSIVAVATDAAGRQGLAALAVTVDLEPPSLEIEEPRPDQIFNGPNIRVAGFVTDQFGVASLSIDGSQAVLTGGRFETEVAIPEGLSRLLIQATDLAGNVSHGTIRVSRVTLPTVEVSTPTDLSIVAADVVDVTGSVSPGAEVLVNGVTATVDGGSFTASGIPVVSGANVIDVVAALPGGQRASTAKVTVFRDTDAPRLLLYAPSEGEIVRSPSFAVHGLVNDLSLGRGTVPPTVWVNGAPAEVSNGTFVLGDLSLLPGENTITVLAQDSSGNSREIERSLVYEPMLGPGIEIVSGNLQVATVGELLPEPLVVRRVDANGEPQAGEAVFFKVTANDGVLEGDRRQLVATTDAAGLASVQLTLGNRAGAASQRVSATTPGVVGGVDFLATSRPGPPAHVFVDRGDQQVGMAGRLLPDPFVAVVTDAGFNRLSGVSLFFQVVRGEGTFTNHARSIEVETDSAGKAVATLRLDPIEGVANNVVEARLEGNLEAPIATFVASGRAGGDPAATRVSGLVLDNTDLPVPGVEVHIAGTELEAVTDDAGLFDIPGAPVGSLLLEVDGATTSRPGSWPHLEFELTTIPGRDNSLGRPIYLLPLDDRGLPVSPTAGGTLTLPELPGFALEVEPGSVTFPNGGTTGEISVTVVHNDKVPMVPNFGQQPRLVFSIQPGGAKFDPPARLTLPNVDGLAPGAVTEMYSFDHDLGSFVSIGPATVSDDALQVVSNLGVGVVEAGWHCGGDPSTAGTPYACAPCTVCDGSQCVPGCSTGPSLPEFFRKTDCGCSDNDVCTNFDGCDSSGGCKGKRILIQGVSAEVNGSNEAIVAVGDVVQFAASAETENCIGEIYKWTFPDGSTETGQSVNHTFSKGGSHRIEVAVSCDDCPQAKTQSVTVTSVELRKLSVSYGATQEDVIGSENWAAIKSESGAEIFIQAEIYPAVQGAADLISWSGGTDFPYDHTVRTVSKSEIGETEVSATLGSETKSLSIWVVWADIELRTSGKTSSSNAARFPEGWGAGMFRDTLGPLTDEEHGVERAEATGKVEIKATIRPISAQSVVSTGWGMRRLVWFDFCENGNVINSGNAEDDGPSIESSDLAPDPDGGIYNIDGPTVAEYFFFQHTRETYTSFEQWVEWRGEQASEVLLWYYQARVDNALHPEDTVLNDVGEGNLILSGECFFAPRP